MLPRQQPSRPSHGINLCRPGTNVGAALLLLIGVLATIIDHPRYPCRGTIKIQIKVEWRGVVEPHQPQPQDPSHQPQPQDPPHQPQPHTLLDDTTNMRGLNLLLLACGDIESNPGPTMKIWIQMQNRRRATCVSVETDTFIDDVVKAGLAKEKLNDVAACDVTVRFDGAEVPPDAAVSGYTDTTASNPLLFEIGEEGLPPKRQKTEFHHPCLGSISASAFAKQSSSERKKKVHEAPLYTHWFAIELYNQYLQMQGSSPPVERHKCTQESLEFVTTVFKTICQMPDAIAQSSSYACTLNRFLFPSYEMDGACLSQCPVIHKSNGEIETADFCVVKWLNGPATPVLVSDVKLRDLTQATSQTAAYAIRAMEVMSESERKRNTRTVCLGLAMGGGKCRLLVYVGDNDFVHEVEIATTSEPSQAFFSVMFEAVHSLLKDPIDIIPVGMKPMKDIRLKPLDYTNPGHVFCSSDKKTVYKMFDSEVYHGSPNLHVMDMIRENYLPNSSVHQLTTDKRVEYLKYDYIEGSHNPTSHTQFQIILTTFANFIEVVMFMAILDGKTFCSVTMANALG